MSEGVYTFQISRVNLKKKNTHIFNLHKKTKQTTKTKHRHFITFISQELTQKTVENMQTIKLK